VYNYINGLVYTAEDDTVSVKESTSFSIIASIMIGENRGDVEYDPVNDIIVSVTAARSFKTNYINKIDPSTNTLIGQEVVSSNEAMNQLIYSRATGLMYAARSNTDQLLVIDPSNTVGNLIVNIIKIGKLLDEPLNNTSWMALNQIVL